jgi:hypothetical protein
MKLPAAVALGVVASVALPYAFRGSSGLLGDTIRNSSRIVHLGDTALPFSPMIFLIVTLFSWAFFVWSDR